MKKKLDSPSVGFLTKSLCLLETPEEVLAYLEDICTPQEILAIAQRSEVAWHLSQGETYQAIQEQTGASTATIARVNRSLENSDTGYELVFRRLKAQDAKEDNGEETCLKAQDAEESIAP